MFTINKEHVKQRMVELQKEARQYELERRCLATKKKTQKPFWENVMNYFTNANVENK